METEFSASAGAQAWQIVPSHWAVGAVLFVLFLYFFVRHFLLVLMVFDLLLSWLRQFSWFPEKGRRLRALVHWGIALGLLLTFTTIAGALGWVKFVPL